MTRRRFLSAPFDMPPDLDPMALADWVELSLFWSDATSVSKSELREALVSRSQGWRRYHNSSPGGSDDNDGGSMAIDNAVGDALLEIARRRLHIGVGYPFTFTDKRVRWDAEPGFGLTYVFLLLLGSRWQIGLRITETYFAEAFETLAAVALRAYLGERARAVRFGSPAGDDYPGSLRARIAWLAPQIQVDANSVDISPQNTGDAGVDVVVWRPHSDGRPGHLILFGQCCIGQNWHEKLAEPNLKVWRGHLGLGTDPSTALIVPMNLSESHPSWRNLRLSCSTFIDRARLAALTPVPPEEIAFQILDFTGWCVAEMLEGSELKLGELLSAQTVSA